MQEYNTAESCIRAVFPRSEIKANRVDVYPIRVDIVAHIGGTDVSVWSGSQMDLFRKYASKRSEAMRDIKANLENLRREVE